MDTINRYHIYTLHLGKGLRTGENLYLLVFHCVLLLSGIVYGPLLKCVGSRWACGLATLLLSAGYFTSSYVNEFPVMFVTFGLMASKS